MKQFNKKNIFEYNLGKKLRFLTYIALTLIIIIGFSFYYYFSLSHMDNFFVNTINILFEHIQSNIVGLSLLGALYATSFGGLFFIPIPTEVLFFAFLKAGTSPFFLVTLYMVGLIISFTINYIVGSRLSEASKKIITPKRFYKIKVSLNKYGIWTIFAFNVLPLPAQPLATLVGVFRYNKLKFYVAFILGQTIKFSVFALAYFYIL